MSMVSKADDKSSCSSYRRNNRRDRGL